MWVARQQLPRPGTGKPAVRPERGRLAQPAVRAHTRPFAALFGTQRSPERLISRCAARGKTSVSPSSARFDFHVGARASLQADPVPPSPLA